MESSDADKYTKALSPSFLWKREIFHPKNSYFND